ncbi:MAG: hypothetical protein J6K63_08995 [Clostridia bacterium]|nr:hypothetical protein [Clostridia bacterium]
MKHEKKIDHNGKDTSVPTQTDTKALLKSVYLYDSEVKLIHINIENLKRLGFIDTSEHIRQLEEKIQRMQAEKIAVTKAIERISDIVARMIFNARYNLGYTWNEITSDVVRMSNRNAHMIHDKAMPEFEKLLAEELSHENNEILSCGAELL